MSREETAIERRPDPPREVEILQQRYTEPDAITRGMAALSSTYNVLSPVRQINTVPIGHALTLAAVSIDAAGDTYPVDGGKVALTKSALDRIAAAIGVSWDPRLSGRFDDGSDPCYVHYRAVGSVVDPDGSRRTICGEKAMDLRDGSEQARAAGKGLAMQRAHILSHAETKAKLRAVRSAVGVRSSYTMDQVRRPFVAVKLVETGDFGDEELNREYARLKMRKMLALDGAAASLYGPGVASLPALECESGSPSVVGTSRHAPPPVGSVSDEADPDGPPVDTERGRGPIRFFELPADAQTAELTGMAARKGKLGDGQGQMTAALIARLDDQQRERLWGKLCDLDDVDPEMDDAGQASLPGWAR